MLKRACGDIDVTKHPDSHQLAHVFAREPLDFGPAFSPGTGDAVPQGIARHHRGVGGLHRCGRVWLLVTNASQGPELLDLKFVTNSFLLLLVRHLLLVAMHLLLMASWRSAKQIWTSSTSRGAEFGRSFATRFGRLKDPSSGRRPVDDEGRRKKWPTSVTGG